MRGFTLLEMVLAIALSVALLVLIGASVNLYLLECDTDRNEVEESQLVRTVLDMIANDLRSTIVHAPQDTSTVASLIQAAKSSKTAGGGGGSGRARGGGGGQGGGGQGGGGQGGGGGRGGQGGGSQNSSGQSSGGDASGSAASSNGSGGSSASQSSSEVALPGTKPGLYGSLNELVLDVSQRPRPTAWLLTDTDAPGAEPGSAPPVRAGDLKTVRYFVREGSQLDGQDTATTGLDPEAEAQVGGLVRQEVDRATRLQAEQAGGDLVDQGLRLVAPEVVRLEFRYFDGVDILESWDTEASGQMPLAVEVRVWLLSSIWGDEDADIRQRRSAATGGQLPASAREYLLTVDLPMGGAQAGAAGRASSSGGAR